MIVRPSHNVSHVADAELVELYREQSIREVAAQVQLSPHTVWRRLRRLGVLRARGGDTPKHKQARLTNARSSPILNTSQTSRK